MRRFAKQHDVAILITIAAVACVAMAVAQAHGDVTVTDNSFSVWWSIGSDHNPTGIAKSYDTGYTIADLPVAGKVVERFSQGLGAAPLTFDVLLGSTDDGETFLAGGGVAASIGDQHIRAAVGVGLLTTGQGTAYVSLSVRF